MHVILRVYTDLCGRRAVWHTLGRRDCHRAAVAAENHNSSLFVCFLQPGSQSVRNKWKTQTRRRMSVTAVLLVCVWLTHKGRSDLTAAAWCIPQPAHWFSLTPSLPLICSFAASGVGLVDVSVSCQGKHLRKSSFKQTSVDASGINIAATATVCYAMLLHTWVVSTSRSAQFVLLMCHVTMFKGKGERHVSCFGRLQVLISWSIKLLIVVPPTNPTAVRPIELHMTDSQNGKIHSPSSPTCKQTNKHLKRFTGHLFTHQDI